MLGGAGVLPLAPSRMRGSCPAPTTTTITRPCCRDGGPHLSPPMSLILLPGPPCSHLPCPQGRGQAEGGTGLWEGWAGHGGSQDLGHTPHTHPQPWVALRGRGKRSGSRVLSTELSPPVTPLEAPVPVRSHRAMTSSVLPAAPPKSLCLRWHAATATPVLPWSPIPPPSAPPSRRSTSPVQN